MVQRGHHHMKEQTVATMKSQAMSQFKKPPPVIFDLSQKQKPHHYVLLWISLLTFFNLTCKRQLESHLGLFLDPFKKWTSCQSHTGFKEDTLWGIWTHLKCPDWVLRLWIVRQRCASAAVGFLTEVSSGETEYTIVVTYLKCQYTDAFRFAKASGLCKTTCFSTWVLRGNAQFTFPYNPPVEDSGASCICWTFWSQCDFWIACRCSRVEKPKRQ